MELTFRSVYQGGRMKRNLRVTIEEGRIASVMPCKEGEGQAGYLVPGYIDEHIHGAFGVDVMDGVHAVLKMASALPAFGVTGFLPTTANALSLIHI